MAENVTRPRVDRGGRARVWPFAGMFVAFLLGTWFGRSLTDGAWSTEFSNMTDERLAIEISAAHTCFVRHCGMDYDAIVRYYRLTAEIAERASRPASAPGDST